MQTRCGGSGRGGGYKTTTYSAWASVAWDWFGNTRSFAKLEGAAEENTSFSETDSHGTASTTSAPRPTWKRANRRWWRRNRPTEVSASVIAVEVGRRAAAEC